ncbi:MAG: hypothetical protein IKT53_07255 [Bacteroidaceae bacterium]|nr:hypothetical protein [Bacteroidaceae bacterium]
MKQLISICARISTPNILKEVEINEVLAMIKKGVCYNQDLRGVTAFIQSQSDHDVQNQLKLQYLPVALFNGTFSYKNSAGLKEYSNFTAIDFDRFNNEQEFNEIGSRLCNTPCVYAVFRTPSGRGLKAIVMHDNDKPECHEELYLQLLSKFNTPATDTSVGDIARGNYICYDPNLLVNSSCVPYHFVHNPQFVNNKVIASHTGTLDKATLRNALSLLKPLSKKSDESIINILNAKWRKDSSRWKEGNRANSIFNSASELCRAGVDMDKSIDYLIDSYKPTGMNEDEIEYQAVRGYQNNVDGYGYTRSVFDNYGKSKW